MVFLDNRVQTIEDASITRRGDAAIYSARISALTDETLAELQRAAQAKIELRICNPMTVLCMVIEELNPVGPGAVHLVARMTYIA